MTSQCQIMTSGLSTIIILSLLSVICDCRVAKHATFEKEKELNHRLNPLQLKDRLLFTYWKDDNSTVITSPEPDFEDCTIPAVLPANRYTLGNGKVIAMTLIVTQFSIFDFHNCSSYSIIPVDDGKPYKYDTDKEIQLVVPYYDTFDVFDNYRRTCKPCRYNDKGERLPLNYSLPSEEEYHKGYFVRPINNSFGVDQGYLYIFAFSNHTTVMKILDPKFNIIKERLFEGQLQEYSLNNGNFTACFLMNTCPKSIFACLSVVCRILDPELNTVATANIHNIDKTMNYIGLTVSNLPTGGAMVGVEFDQLGISEDEQPKTVFIQQIHPDGKVEPAYRVGKFFCNYLAIYDYILDNGEYCLVTSVEKDYSHDNKSYSLVKCVVPKPAKN